jgi:hypothetical protein
VVFKAPLTKLPAGDLGNFIEDNKNIDRRAGSDFIPPM